VRNSNLEVGASPGELDVVAFREQVGRWPAGTEGTIVETFPESALIEVGEEGDALEMIVVPYVALNIVWTARREYAV
jgi:hypothetical protein